MIEKINYIRYRAGEFVKNHHDILWIGPFSAAVINSFQAIRDRQVKPLTSIFETGLAVYSLIQTAKGLKTSSEINQQRQQNQALLAELNRGDSELGQRMREAIAEFKRSQLPD